MEISVLKLQPNINQIPSYAEESFQIEIKSGTWSEALEVCFICLTPNQYLSANILKNIVEIMLVNLLLVFKQHTFAKTCVYGSYLTINLESI